MLIDQTFKRSYSWSGRRVDPQREWGMPFPEQQCLEMQTKPMHAGTYLVVQ